MAKCTLRLEMRGIRNRLRLKLNDEQIERVMKDLIGLLGDRGVVAGYYNVGSEFECLPVLRNLKKAGFQIALPVVGADRVLTFAEWDCRDESLKIGRFNIPSPEGPGVYPNAILVPLLAFDRNLNRLGQGGGYYDATLSHYSSSLSIGLAYSFQCLHSLPTDPHDVPLNHIVTEEGLYLNT